MSLSVRKTNSFFRRATKSEIDKVRSEIVLSERQEKIFDMYYIKRKDLGFIADTLCMSYPAAKSELRSIREKITPLL